jgi:hypothetical protein
VWDTLLGILQRWGAPAGWIAAIVQLLIWIIGFPVFHMCYRRQVQKLQQIVDEQQEEIAKMEDLANAWFQMTKAAVAMMRSRSPKVYRDYVNSYGGEHKFTNWWVIPEIPYKEALREDEEIER